MADVEMYARLDGQGTACGETAVCGPCLRKATNEQFEFLDADDTVTSHQDCSGNEALSCQLCGVTTDGR